MTEEEKKDKLAKVRARKDLLKQVSPERAEKLSQEGLKKGAERIITGAEEEAKRDKKQKKEAEKGLSKEDKAIKRAKDKVDEAKKKLAEAKKKDNAKDIKKAEEALKKAEAKLKKAKEAKVKKNQKSLGELTADMKKKEAEMDKAGIAKKDPKDKDDKNKNKDKTKENEQTKTDQKAKLASRINVNMDIQQHGPKFVLVGKNGRETDVTDVMNEIDKYNKGVDAKNAAAKAQGAVQKGVEAKANEMDPKGQGLPTNGANGNVVVKGTPELVPSIPPALQKGAEDIVAAKLPALDPEERAFVAKTALELSKLDLLKDPKAMEKLNERKKNNDKEEQEKLLALRAKQSTVTK